MITLLNKIKYKVNKFFERKLEITPRPFRNLVTLGTSYGAWTIPGNLLHANSICYLVGAGEDISFDIAVADKYKSKVFIFDPTPRAYQYYQKFRETVEAGNKFIVEEINYEYKISITDLQKVTFLKIGMWNENTTLKFFAPKNKNHISHSAVNLQKTDTYFEAKVKRLSTIMQEQNHEEIDLLKIDIEGAEYKVIESIIEDQVKVKTICVEFDEINNHLDKAYIDRIENAIQSIIDYGYSLIAIDQNYNSTFIRNDIYRELAEQ